MTIRHRRPSLRVDLKAFGKLEATDIVRLAARYHVTTRTIYRDIEAIRRAGYRVPPYAYRESANVL